jgi:hypothetical protein
MLEGMTVVSIAQIEPDVACAGWPPVERVAVDLAAAEPAYPLGPLSELPGTWKGHGFNAIWRPHIGGQDRFLELNLTTETLVFSQIDGPIPNWGLLRPDINLVGISCMHQIAEASSGAGLHIEPGVLAHVPSTTDPREPATVVRMASIPARTVILAQGTAQRLDGGPPHIPDNTIIPCPIGGLPSANSAFPLGERGFPELDLATPTAFRYAWPGVTQAMVENPNGVLQAAIHRQPVSGRTVIRVSSPHTPHTPTAVGQAAPRRLSPPGRTLAVATPTRWRSTPRSGSRHCLEPTAGPTPSNCSTPNSCSSTSTATAGRTSEWQRCTSS